jgi:predicted DNA binding CopG/RHH family protein
MKSTPDLESEEQQLLDDFEAGSLRSVASAKMLDQLRAAARSTGQKDQRINIRLSSPDLLALRTRAANADLLGRWDARPHGWHWRCGDRQRLPSGVDDLLPAPQPMPDPEGPASQQPAAPPESMNSLRPWPGLDRLGWLQAFAGLVIGLIALFSSYDHITLAGRSLRLQQQWGIFFIAASLATVVVDAQLASRSRLRDAYDRQVDRNRADQDRNRAAESRERQVESLERLHSAAVLSARVQLDPSATNRARLRAFLALISGEIPPDAGENGV